MLNILMVMVGIFILAVNVYNSRKANVTKTTKPIDERPRKLWFRRLLFTAICMLPLVIPSDATRDVPATYGQRHQGIVHSWMYPDIKKALADAHREKEKPE